MSTISVKCNKYISNDNFIAPYQNEIDTLQRETQLKFDEIINKIQKDIDVAKKIKDSWRNSMHWTHSIRENEDGTYNILCTSNAPEELKHKDSTFETKVSQPFSFVNNVLITHSVPRYWQNNGVKNGTVIGAITQRHILLGKVPKEFYFKL